MLTVQPYAFCEVLTASPVSIQNAARNALLQGVQNYVVVLNLKQKKIKLKIRKAIRAWEAIGDRLQAPSDLSRVIINGKSEPENKEQTSGHTPL